MYEYPRVGCSKAVGQLWKKHDHRTLQNVTALAPEDIEIRRGVVRNSPNECHAPRFKKKGENEQFGL